MHDIFIITYLPVYKNSWSFLRFSALVSGNMTPSHPTPHEPRTGDIEANMKEIAEEAQSTPKIWQSTRFEEP